MEVSTIHILVNEMIHQCQAGIVNNWQNLVTVVKKWPLKARFMFIAIVIK